MKETDIIAIDQHVPRAGTILMWTLSGATDLQDLTAAWLAEGLDRKDLPTPPTPAIALRRALNEQRDSHTLVRPLTKKGPTGKKVNNGFAVVDETARGDDDLVHDIAFRAKLDPIGRLLLTGGSYAQRDAVRDAFDRHGDELATEDMSAWLVGMMPKFDAVSMRGTGGVYFIPFTRLDELNHVVEAIRNIGGHSIYRIPAMRGDDAVEAILDAIQSEAAEEAHAMEIALEKAQFGERGWEHRISKTDTIEGKVARYEALLGARLDGIRERLTALRANLTIAMVKAQAEDDTNASLASL